jgi:Fe-S-cluster containining protein
MSTNKFPCVGCGACCRKLNLLSEEQLKEVNLKAREDGSCVNLNEDNSCAVYEDRPEICIVSNRGTGYTTEEYHKMVAEICNEWMDEEGSDYPRINL